MLSGVRWSGCVDDRGRLGDLPSPVTANEASAGGPSLGRVPTASVLMDQVRVDLDVVAATG